MKFRFDEIAFNSTLKKKPVEEDKIHYIGLEHIEPGNFSITEWGSDVAPVGEKLIMKKGDILFGKRRAYQRKVAIAPFDGIFSAHGMVLRPKTDVIDADFFPLFISSDTFMETAMRISVGGLSPTINWKDLKEQEFELPSLEEQQTIAKKAWAAYRLKEAYQRLLSATDEMVKSQFIEWFGNAIQSVPLEDVVEILDNKRKPLNDSQRSGMKSGQLYPYYGATGVVDYVNAFLTDEDLICLAEDCGAYGPGEQSSYIIEGKAWVNNHAHVLRAKDNVILKYLQFFFTLTDLNEFISGTTRKKLTQSALKKIKVTLPDIELQELFVAIAEQADKSKFELKRAIEAIDKVIKSLING